MKTKRPLLPALLCAALLAGCATRLELIEKRIGQKADFFAALPAEEQQRLRAGTVAAGDTRDAAWIVYGRPDRTFQKVTATSTNEVWSYVIQENMPVDDLRPVYHPVRGSGTRPLARADTVWSTDRAFAEREYLRIEFQNDRILTIESDHPQKP